MSATRSSVGIVAGSWYTSELDITSQLRDLVPNGSVDDVHHSFDRDVEHEIRLGIEVFRPVDEGEMTENVDVLTRARHDLSVADVALDQFDMIGKVNQASGSASRIVVEHANGVAAGGQSSHQGTAEKSRSPRDQIPAGGQRGAFPPIAIASGIRTATVARWDLPRLKACLTPHMNHLRYSNTQGPREKDD